MIANKTIQNTTKTSTNMTTKVYDINMGYAEAKAKFDAMSNIEIAALMENERMSLTMAPGGENNRGMEIIGRMPFKGEGFTASDIEGLGPYFKGLCPLIKDDNPVAVLDLNALSLNDDIDGLENDVDQARVLILRDYMANWHGAQGWTQEVYKELAAKRWDAEYLDPNKYRTEIVDGKEVKVRGKRMNKRARTNLCFVDDREQAPAVYEGKGTIYDLKKMGMLRSGVEALKKQIAEGIIAIDSKTKVEINVVEGNRYYDLKNTGIGYHGDTERVVVICFSIGGSNYPMRWQWFKDGMPVGNQIQISLNDGDVYIMSEKAVGADWKLRKPYTLRHAAGAKKYISLKKWEDRAAKKALANSLKVQAEPAKQQAKAVKEELKVAKALKKEQAKAAKEELKAAKAKKVVERKAKQAERKAKQAERKAKIEADKLANPEKYYRRDLKKLDWEESDRGFYSWLAVQTAHECAPKHEYFKEFEAIWTGKADDFSSKMDPTEFDRNRKFYDRLCDYGKLM